MNFFTINNIKKPNQRNIMTLFILFIKDEEIIKQFYTDSTYKELNILGCLVLFSLLNSISNYVINKFYEKNN